MTENKANAFGRQRDWIVAVVQTCLLLIVLGGMALSNERRMTTVEQSNAATIERMRELGALVYNLQQNQIDILQNQARMLVTIDKIEKNNR